MLSFLSINTCDIIIVSGSSLKISTISCYIFRFGWTGC